MLRLAGVLAVLLPTAACGLFRSAADAPRSLTRAISGESEAAPPDPVAQQQSLNRVALLAIEGIRKACDELAASGSESARLDAARWTLRGSQMVVTLATQPQTVPAMIELLISLQLRRRVAEDRVLAQYGEAARPLVATLTTLEQEGWKACEQMIGAERAADAHKRVDEWGAGLGAVDEQALLRRPTLDEVLKPQASEGGGFWSWLEIDPFSGLEPAAREIALMRMYGERVLFYTQQLPHLASDEVRLAALEARGQPEFKDVLANMDRISGATASIGKLADELPGLVHTEREEAIRQVAAELEAQRRGLVADLETARAPLKELLDASRATLGATDAAALQLTALVTAVDGFMARFDRPAAATPVTPAPAAPGPAAPPFAISDYGGAATKLAEAARELTALVAQLDHSMPELQRTIDATTQRADATIAAVIARALWSGLALIAATAIAIVIVRRFSRQRSAA